MGKWLTKNIFWILAFIIVALGAWALGQGNVVAGLLFLTVFVFVMVVGMYFANVEFTKDVLQEYDRLTKVQEKRKFKVLKGGK